MYFHTRTFRKRKESKQEKIFLGGKKQINHLYLEHVGSVPKGMLSRKTHTMPSSLRLLQNKPLTANCLEHKRLS